VELERLARGEPQRRVAVLPREPIERDPLLRRANTARQPHAHHELITRLELGEPPLLAQVSIVLLIDAEEFRQQRVVVRHRTGDFVRKALRDRAPQVPARVLQTFIAVQRLERRRAIERCNAHQYTSF
jgi:hypothetical protein